MRDARGKITGVMGALIDITEHKRSEEELRPKSEQLAERVRALHCLYEAAQVMGQPALEDIAGNPLGPRCRHVREV